MKPGLDVAGVLIGLCLFTEVLTAQQRPGGAGPEKSLIQRFDANGDGQIDDQERRAVREKMKQLQNKPGAMTPSGKTDTVAGRLITEMQYASSDGRMIPCVLSMPQGTGPFPVLVTIHGGQGNRDLGYIRTMAAPNGLSPTITAFNEQPWAILAISYRAGNGALFGMEQEDVIAGIRFAKTLPNVDASRVGVVGGRHGGHLALVAAEKMGREFLCVAAGSPWMTDPVVYMQGDPGKPPLSLVRTEAREDLMQNGRRILNGMQRGRGMSEQQLQAFIREHSIEANAGQIEIPTLFITSRGDDQAPHVLIEPMIRKMQEAKQNVQVYTAEKSPHGFYWARTVSAARDLRGEKTKVEADEELAARRVMIEFFTKHFGSSNEPPTTQTISAKMTREAFRQKYAGSAALAKRPEIADRLFDRLDIDGDGELSASESAGMDDLRSQFSRSGNQPGTKRGKMGTSGPAPGRDGMERGASSGGGPQSSARPVSAKTAPLQIASGSLTGEQAGEVRIFRGIPYAAAPVGELRWQPPQPVQPWTGVRDATQFSAPALQGETFSPRSAQSEDCLYLNVWTPSSASDQSKLPVLVWIHGGAFIQGSGAQPRYDGSQLAKRGAVVVTINYRLGPLGLFAHPVLTADSKPEEPLGNYCLTDMLAALRWTQQNIAAFGGDPGNVTISGSSAGGTSCLFLMGIAQADGLFHKAIINSSGGIRNIQSLAEAEAAGLRLAERWGLGPTPRPADLRRVTGDDVAVDVGAIRQLELPVKPLIDGRLVHAVPADVFAAGKQLRVPVLIGAANGESGARELSDEVAAGGAFGFQRQLADHMQRAGQSVWMFQLTCVPPQARTSRYAAQHGETVACAFGTFGQSIAAQYGFRNTQTTARARGAGRGGEREDDSVLVEDSEQGRKISAAMLEYWVNFMRNGKPGGKDLPPWPAYSADSPRTMVFGNADIAVR
ncbi:MAG: carboxylesterase family protein [Planctomycetaceae bacterium]